MVKKEDKTKKKTGRSTTSLNIDKDDLSLLNQLRAYESGRRKVLVSHPEFIRFLLCLYQEVVEHDSRILEKAAEREL